jgi:hypothetical protein
MMRLTSIAVLLFAIGFPRDAAAQTPPRKLQLTFEGDGTVTLEAASVSAREVLVEWARHCGCLIVNAQNVPGTLDVPVLFSHARQEVVLASLLRRAAGYALTPRRAGMTGPSQFETIYVLPTSNPSAAAAFSIPQPSYAPPPPPTTGSPADEIPPVTPIPAAAAGAASPGGPGGTQPPATQAAPPAPRLPGTPTRFVPIVPIGPGQGPSTPSAPGATTAGAAAPAPAAPNAAPAPPVLPPR